MEKFNFAFSVEETNIILNALASQPYGQVAKLIESIQQQAQSQVKPAEEKAE